MKNSPLVAASIVLLFALLWLPLGQYDFLMDHWMKIGIYAVPFLLIGGFSLGAENQLSQLIKNARFIGFLMLIAYIVHQYEEHWIDLFGNYYAFYDFNNHFILTALGQPDAPEGPLTKEAIFVINTSLVWLVGSLAIWRSPRHLFPLIAMAGIILVNGAVHVLASISQFQYNPGLLTSLVIFIPLFIWFIRYLRGRIPDYKRQIVLGLVWAFLAHVIMVAGLLLANWFLYIPEFVYFVLLVLWSLVPLLIANPKAAALK
ncbi:MAG: HXXEE domain-containing protein [Bacteroidota bacterium]